MKYLIFDCSPIDKPKDYKAPFTDTFAWPRLMHLSWIVLDKDFKPKEDFDCIIDPEGFKLTKTIQKRVKIDNPMFRKERICLMQESTYYCKIPNRRGSYKWPSLTELHAICFQQRYAPANNARADVIAAARSFIKLMKIGQLEDLFDEEE